MILRGDERLPRRGREILVGVLLALCIISPSPVKLYSAMLDG